MRETPNKIAFILACSGITPAYAGNTITDGRKSTNDWDHPRVCGKHLRKKALKFKAAGSPPRMRETPLTCRFFRGILGITPAYAGNTLRICRAALTAWDHPRVCGKHFKSFSRADKKAGSPPRMRETLVCSHNYHRLYGITPAYAGNTHANQSTASAPWDHPRVCGKHCVNFNFVLSSFRITPAYAGNTKVTR